MKILLVDDHPLILSAVKSVMTQLDHSLEVVGAQSAEKARAALKQDSEFDLLLLDLALGEVSGYDLLVELRSAYPALPVVILSATERISDVIRVIDAGAMGFVSKRSSHEELVQALKTVMSGGLYVPQNLLDMQRSADAAHALPVGGHASLTASAGAAGAAGVPARAKHARELLAELGLTPRQGDVLGLLLKGMPNKLIARQLDLSVETVKDHVAAVLRALNVNTRTQAVLLVTQVLQEQSEGVFPGIRSPETV